MYSGKDPYRLLQRHLDRQAIGFPASRSSADLRLLRRLFTPAEAKLARYLNDTPASTPDLERTAAAEFPVGDVPRLLETMHARGAIGWRQRDGIDQWFLMPLVIGMYEQQDGNPEPGFLADASAYMRTLAFKRSFVNVRPPQMRTIPVAKSIPLDHPVATYDEVRGIVADAPGPFAVLPCICRRNKELKDAPCSRTARHETCLAFGDMAAGVLRRGHGREIALDEVLAILRRNEEDGLVLQPANARRPDFICSCCGCCCGMLSYQRALPRPLEFWTSTYHAAVDLHVCAQCGTCVSRCQVNAITLTGAAGAAMVNLERCIGCGLCVTTCPAHAVRLVPRIRPDIPPRDQEHLLEQIQANRKGPLGEWVTVLKIALRMMR